MMKLNKIYIAFAALFSMVLASCSSDDEYTPAEQLKNAQVYFSNELASSINLSLDKTSIEIPVSRVKTDEALSVNVVATVEGSEYYTIPTSVNFAQGENTANLVISYNPDEMEFEDYSTVTLKIAEDEYTTPYGISSYSFNIGLPAPWTPWTATKDAWVKAGYSADEWPLSETASTCTYTYTQIFGGADTELPIFYRKSLLNDEQAQIRIDNWCYGVSLILDYNPKTGEINIEPQFTGYTDSGVGDFYLTDVAHWQGKPIAGWESSYDKEKGLISLATAWMAGDNHSGCYGYGWETIQLDGFYIPDYSIDATLEGTLTDTGNQTYALLNVAGIGVDVEAAKALVVNKSDDAAAVADAILAGDVEAEDLVVGNNKLSLNDLTGELQVVIVSIAEGALQGIAALPFEFYGGGANPWKSLGIGVYTDDFVVPLYTEAKKPYTYEVEIQESTETPGVYRMVNAYAPVAAAFGEEGGNANILINAENPDAVYILPQPIGMNLGDGDISIASEAGRYVGQYGFETVMEKLPNIFGTLKNGVITLPLLEASNANKTPYQGITFLGDKGYYGGMNGAFKLVLPGASAKAKANVKAAARAAHFAARLNSYNKMKKQVNNYLTVKTLKTSK